MGRLLEYVVDVVFVVIVGRLLGTAFRHLFGAPPVHPPRDSDSSRGWREPGQPETVQGKMVRDPVCGMFVSTELSHRLDWQGRTFHFCSTECREAFKKTAAAAG